jgi:hypothetical protein
LIDIFNLAIADRLDDDGNRAGGLVSDGPTINEEQEKQLLAALEVTESNIERFCSAFGIEAPSDLPAAKFGEAMALLRKKAERMGAIGESAQ